MKSILISALTIICGTFAALADESAPAAPIVAETLFEDGSTNTWTSADLQQALGLMNRKYHREQETDHGRAQWHGKRMGQYLLDDGNGGQCLVVEARLAQGSGSGGKGEGRGGSPPGGMGEDAPPARRRCASRRPPRGSDDKRSHRHRRPIA